MQKLCTITNKDEKKLFKTFYKVWGTRKFNHKEGQQNGNSSNLSMDQDGKENIML